MGKMRTVPFFLLFLTMGLSLYAEPVLKVANGRVKEILPAKQELVLSFLHPVTGKEEELTLHLDGGTGFSKGLTLEGLKVRDAVTVDYEEKPDGLLRAVRVNRVPLRGIPSKIQAFKF